MIELKYHNAQSLCFTVADVNDKRSTKVQQAFVRRGFKPVQNISNGHQNKSVKCEPPLMPRGENHKEEEECDWIYYLAKKNLSFESALVSLFGVNGKKKKNQLR